MGARLEENRQQAELSYQLATIKTDVALELRPGELKISDANEDALKDLYAELEFRRWLGELLKKDQDPGSSAAAPEDDPSQNVPQQDPADQGIDRSRYQVISSESQFSDWLNKLEGAELFALDTETTSLNYMQAELVGISFATAPGEAAYLPLAHKESGEIEQLPLEWVLAKLKPLLEDETRLKVGQNIKYDMSVLARYGINLRGVVYDTMLESYVLKSIGSRHDMDTLSLTWLGHKPISYEEVAGKGAKQLTFDEVPLEQAAPYAAEDADVTLQLHHKIWPELEQQPSLQALYQELEAPLIPVLSRMERTGVMIDCELLAEQSKTLQLRIDALEQKAYELAGYEFKLGSTKQLQELLFDKLKLPVLKKTPKGAPSTAEEVLQELALDYPLPKVILEYRSLTKLKSTYTDKLPKMVDPDTSRVHTSYHQAVTATGRLSSSDPNLQNIPVRNEEGRLIRRAFVAPEGYRILAADYSQIELRIMAHLSGDKGLLEAFSQGLDIHRATAAEVFGVSPEQVSSDQRRSAKAINFGLIYGMSAFGLSRQLGISRVEAQSYMDKYFERYPGVESYMEKIREQAKLQGYVETLFGRRLYLPEINARNGARRKAAERAAINAPMQGTAADIIKRAMLEVDRWIAEQAEGDARLLMQVHDELVLEVRHDKLAEVQSKVVELMQQAADLAVPLLVEAGEGDNWDQAH